MNKTFTFLSISLFTMIFAFSANAQVTITASDYMAASSPHVIDSFHIIVPNSAIAEPIPGPDQVWDFSGVKSASEKYNEYLDAAGDTIFPNAYDVFNNNLTFGAFVVPNFFYYGLDVDSRGEIGNYSTEVTYPIGSVTGGADDKMVFVESINPYAEKRKTLDFPVEYQKSWSSAHRRPTKFELSAASFGLVDTPGSWDRIWEQSREVIGYGKIIIPTETGEPSAQMDVLLIKGIRTRVDSIYLGGAPAPPTLLGAFGATQGATASAVSYYFYRSGFDYPIFRYVSNGNHEYRSRGAIVSTGVNDIIDAGLSHFPNPVAAGHQMTFETKIPVYGGTVQLYDITGQLVHFADFESNAGNQFQINIPSKLKAGTYFCSIRNREGSHLGSQKIHVN